MKKVVNTLCFMCSVRCPIQVTVENEQVVSIRGNPHVPTMNGGVCPKAAAAAASHLSYGPASAVRASGSG
jgi:thiosulfate reductase / polysulfide reductase chain A